MRRLWAIVVLGLSVAACGIPVDGEPEAVDVEIVAPPADEAPTPGDLVGVSMYLVRDDELVEVTRELPSPPSVISIYDSLLDGVTEPEREANLRTAIPPGTATISVTEDGSVLEIDLSREFASVGGEEEILAVAQIVLTATSIEGIDQVSFLLDGVPTDVPVVGGALSVDPVTAADYSALLTE